MDDRESNLQFPVHDVKNAATPKVDGNVKVLVNGYDAMLKSPIRHKREPMRDISLSIRQKHINPIQFSPISTIKTPKHASKYDPFSPKEGSIKGQFIIKSPLNHAPPVSMSNQAKFSNNPETPAEKQMYHEFPSIREDQTLDFDPAEMYQKLYKPNVAEETFMDDEMDAGNENNNSILNTQFLHDGNANYSQASSEDSDSPYLKEHEGILREAMQKMNLASPGNYFGSKSCKFGFLDGVGKVNDRPFFDTPKKTNRGDIIDHLSTPFYERDFITTSRDSSNQQTPSKRFNFLPETPANLKLLHKPAVLRETPVSCNNNLVASTLPSPIQTAPIQNIPSSTLTLPTRSGFSFDSKATSTLTIQFPIMSYVEKGRLTLCLINSTNIRSAFSLGSIGKPKVEASQAFGLKAPPKHVIDSEVFQFEILNGSLDANEQKVMKIFFRPVIAGIYTQSFLLRCNGKGITINVFAEASSKRVADSSGKAPTRMPQRNIKSFQAKRKTAANPYTVPVSRTKVRQPPKIQQNDASSLSDKNTLVFNDLAIGRSLTLDLRVMNPKTHACTFDVFVTAPFAVPTRSLQVPADSYTTLPVAFRPTRPGLFTTFIVVKYGSEVFKVKLSGKAHMRK